MVRGDKETRNHENPNKEDVNFALPLVGGKSKAPYTGRDITDAISVCGVVVSFAYQNNGCHRDGS